MTGLGRETILQSVGSSHAEYAKMFEDYAKAFIRAKNRLLLRPARRCLSAKIFRIFNREERKDLKAEKLCVLCVLCG
jgi:hypothetical protein